MWRPGEPPSCALCGGNGAGGGGDALAAAAHLGALLGPLHDPRSASGEPVYVHRMCALWCPQVFQTDRGTLRNVLSEVRRARQIKCAGCGRRGAATGCHVPSCPLSFHLPCAAAAGCAFEPEKYLLWCEEHAPARLRNAAGGVAAAATPFPRAAVGGAALVGAGLEWGTAHAEPGALTTEQKQQQLKLAGVPAGASPLLLTSPPTEPPAGQRLDGRRGRAPPAAVREHLMAARGALKRARREMEAAAARRGGTSSRRRQGDESSDDDQHFRNKEARRLAADTAKLNPVTLGGPGGLVVQHLAQRPVAKGALPGVVASADTAAAAAIAGCDFSDLAGMDDVVRQLREMVLLPLQYPALFASAGLRPPRKGADCLGKFHGEAERTLRLLFEEASRRAPSIIFLDELDALVPPRAGRGGGADQIYASVVSTLLALMDGVADRGAVVVIGATNRPEGIDPALRRPGRFDREVHFGLPSPAQRAAILRAHTRHWAPPPGELLLARVAAAAEGHAGADLRALCSAAVMAAARRAAPALLELAEAQRGEGQGGEEQRSRWRQRLLEGVTVEPRDWRAALASAPPPCSRRPSLSALSAAAAAAPLPPPLLPLLARPLRALLAALHAAGLPLPPGAAAAARAAAAGGDAAAFEASLLQQCMPVAGASSESLNQRGESLVSPGDEAGGGDWEDEEQAAGTPAHHQPCRLLLAGEGERGQEAAAGALLRLLEGCAVHAVSLPTLIVAGQGDATAGVVALVREALRQAGPGRPLILHLPRLEGWALHQERLPMECEEEEEGGGGAGLQKGGAGAKNATARTPGGATPRGGSTPRRAYPVAPSPFSGLLPLEARGHNTPAVARDMGPPPPSLPRSQQRSRSAGSGQQQQQQQLAAADPPLASADRHPLLALPRIRTSASPVSHPLPGLDPSHQQQRRPLAGGPGGPVDAAMEVLEVTRLSEAWSAFESLVKQAPPSQPLLLLATCHAPLDSLPPLLLKFFTCAPASVAVAQTTAEAAAAAAPPSVVVIGNPSPEEWAAAAGREADSVAAGVAARAAAALRSRLEPRDAAEPSPPPQQQQQQQQQEAGVQPRQWRAEPEVCSGDDKDGAADEQANAADLERGLALFAQVDAFMRALGAALHADRRSDVAGARVRYGGGGGQPQRTAWCSFRGLAAHAQGGGYASLEQLQSDAAATARKIAAACTQQADAARGGGGSGQLSLLRQRTAVAAACALLDEIDERCHALRQALALDDPDNARLLRIASMRHRAQQRRDRADTARQAAEGADQEVGSEPEPEQAEQQRWQAQQGEPMEEEGASMPGLHDGAAKQQHQLEERETMAETAEQPYEQQEQHLNADTVGSLPSFLASKSTFPGQHVAAARAFQQELQRRLIGLLRSCMACLPLPSSAAAQALQEASAVLRVEAGAACVATVEAAVAEGAKGLELVGGSSALAAACSEAVQEMRLPWYPT